MDELIGQKNLPPLLPSVAPIVVPIVLILLKTVLDFANASNSVIDLLGSPIIALAIGTLLAIYGLARNKTKDETLKYMDNAIKTTGIIMLITGAGGSLGQIIKDSGIGNALGEMVTRTPLPAVLIPFVIAALRRIALGSATVALLYRNKLCKTILTYPVNHDTLCHKSH